MKLLILLGIIVGGYTYVMLHTTDIVMSQTEQLSATYQRAAENAEQLAGDTQNP